MKYFHKYILYVSSAIFLLTTACDDNDEFTALQVSAPTDVGAVIDIANDNSGLVTVAPTATGAASFQIYFGDDPNAAPTEVTPGGTAQHTYPEGQFNMRIVAIGADGATAETTQPITVQFAPPENLSIDVSISNRSVNVTPSAEGATLFEVYFGENEGETPVVIMPGETANYVYSASGTYTVRVVAKGAGAATTEATQEVQVQDLINLPLTFEQGDLTFTFNGFGGGGAGVVDNPDPSGINTSAKVVSFIKQPGAEVWGGVTIDLAQPIDFASFRYFRLKLWSPKEGVTFLLKVENLADANLFHEVSAVSTKTNEWEELLFDFGGADPAFALQRMAIFVDFGVNGDGSEFFIDDIELTNQGPEVTTLSLPISFESDVIEYSFTNFGGAESQVINNPDPSGINTSNKVSQLFKNNGSEVWAGSFLTLPEPIRFTDGTTFRMKVWSPKAGIIVKLKLENATDPNIAFEVDVATTTANAWEELAFDFSGIDQSQSFQKVVTFFDFGNPGDGSAYFYDDIRISEEPATETLSLPLSFESETLTYAFTNFGNATAEVIDNPDASGANTSSKVGRLFKANGAEVWAGSFLTLDGPMDFNTRKSFTVKTWSPKVGAIVKLKVENSADPNIAYEIDVATTTANAWEELTYDFSGIDASQSYDRVVIFFDFGNPGDDTEYYFDDITLQ